MRLEVMKSINAVTLAHVRPPAHEYKINIENIHICN